MTAHTTIFGHDVIIDDDDIYRWADDEARVNENPRPCPVCGEFQTDEGHDPCIANLPGIQYACCGHGKEKPYIVGFACGLREFDTVAELLEFVEGME